MILKDFFSYYFGAIDPEVLSLYQELAPPTADLATTYEELFTQNGEEAIAFLLKFHRVTAELRLNRPEQAILFNVHNNVCFPFFVEYLWKAIDEEKKEQLKNQAKASDLKAITAKLIQDRHLRNWVRKEISTTLSQTDLFILNEIIALQNFSSGGEFSFLQYAYPDLGKVKGKILDAGCGSGFATLVMSQQAEVYSIDACKARLERAMALSDMMRRGDKKIFPQVLALIEEELGSISVQCEFPSAQELLKGSVYPVSFQEGSIDTLPYPEGFFAAVNCLDVLEHTFAPEKIVQEFSRVMQPGGQVFITAPTRYGEVEQHIHESIAGTMFPAMLHMHHFDQDLLNNMFDRYGFEPVKLVPFDYMSWEQFLDIAAKSPDVELANALKAKPFDQVALQIFAIYRKK